jgi:protein-tyrosine phosphatase
MIDLHCHILPGVDDGAVDIEESIEMARQAIDDGIRILVATPHTLNGVYSNFSDEVDDRVAALQKVFSKNDIHIKLYPGSEIHLCFQMADQVLSGKVATLNNSGRYALIEFPFQTIPAAYKDEIFQLKLNNITPIIAHPERNLICQNQFDIFYELISLGCLIQITAMSVTGELGEEPMECAHKLLDLRLAHIIASDAHSANTRPAILSPALEIASQIMGNEQEARALVIERPEAILAGQSVEMPEPRRPRKKWWPLGL